MCEKLFFYILLYSSIFFFILLYSSIFFYILLVSEEEDSEVAKEEELLKELKLLVERRERMEKFAEKRAKGGEYLQKKGLILPEGMSDYSASVIFTIPELQIMHFLLEVTHRIAKQIFLNSINASSDLRNSAFCVFRFFSERSRLAASSALF